MHTHEDAIRQALGPHQFGFRVRGGAEIVQHALRITLEASPKMGMYSTDKRNAFNTGSRESMYDALVRNPSLQPLMYFFRMMYLDREGRLMYYHNGELACTIRSAEGTRQGCVRR